MFKINFNRALLISLAWHALCFFMFTIVVAPSGIRNGKFSDVSFLGSILDEGAFSRGPGSIKTRPVDAAIPDRLFKNDIAATYDKRLKSYLEKDPFLQKKSYRSSVDSIMAMEKAPPTPIPGKSGARALKDRSEVTGEARDRAVVFHPPMPDYSGPLSLLEAGLKQAFFKVRLKILIAPDGSVKAVESIQSSGYPEVDFAAIRYAKKWQFEPLSAELPQYDQEGIMNVEFKIK